MDGHTDNGSLHTTEDPLPDLSEFRDEDLFEDVKDLLEVTSEDGYENEEERSNGIKRKNSLHDDFDSTFSPSSKYMKTTVEEPGLTDALSKESSEENSVAGMYSMIEINGILTIVHKIPPQLEVENLLEQQYCPVLEGNDELEHEAITWREINAEEAADNELSQSSKSEPKTTVPIWSEKKAVSTEELQAERRRRNNDSSRRSRQSKRQKNKEMEGQVKILEGRNEELKAQIENLKTEVTTYKKILINWMAK